MEERESLEAIQEYVMCTLLFKRRPKKNVICLGMEKGLISRGKGGNMVGGEI